MPVFRIVGSGRRTSFPQRAAHYIDQSLAVNTYCVIICIISDARRRVVFRPFREGQRCLFLRRKTSIFRTAGSGLRGAVSGASRQQLRGPTVDLRRLKRRPADCAVPDVGITRYRGRGATASLTALLGRVMSTYNHRICADSKACDAGKIRQQAVSQATNSGKHMNACNPIKPVRWRILYT